MTFPTRVNLADTFRLHSNPTATKTIYLDFDGHITTDRAWTNPTNPTLTTAAFSTDANTAAFSDAELERIQFIWQRVAEDFLPFGVNVTTEDPGEAALVNAGGKDDRWGVRVAIGGSSSDWYGSSAGGVAVQNSFGDNRGPAFVFSKSLGSGNEKYTAEAISHEVGHTLGLIHDGAASSSGSYFQGQGKGLTGWAPIMGVAYGKPVSQWSQGEFNKANNVQDDLATIASRVGFRADDFGDTIAHAKPLSGPSLNQFGLIATRKDSDWFSFSTGAGNVSLLINNATQAWVSSGGGFTSYILAGRSPNLDIAASLFAADGTLIATSNPFNKLSASFNLSLAAGAYYLMVDGVGFGDPATNGYSDYGSLGGYLVTGTLI